MVEATGPTASSESRDGTAWEAVPLSHLWTKALQPSLANDSSVSLPVEHASAEQLLSQTTSIPASRVVLCAVSGLISVRGALFRSPYIVNL